MHHLTLAALFRDFSFEPWMIAVIIPVAVFIFVGTIAISAMHFKHQKQMAWHQTARLALEKGQPVPPQPGSEGDLTDAPPPTANLAEWERAKREQQRRNDVRAGLILIAVGVGTYVMMRHIAGTDMGYVGAIPGLIGVALLLHGLLDRALGGSK